MPRTVDWNVQTEQIEREGEEDHLKTTSRKKTKALDLPPPAAAEDIAKHFGSLLNQLPANPKYALLRINQRCWGAGLQFELFKPSAEDPKRF